MDDLSASRLQQRHTWQEHSHTELPREAKAIVKAQNQGTWSALSFHHLGLDPENKNPKLPSQNTMTCVGLAVMLGLASPRDHPSPPTFGQPMGAVSSHHDSPSPGMGAREDRWEVSDYSRLDAFFFLEIYSE